MSGIELTPELRDVVERIWRGRRDLMRNQIIPDSLEGLTVVVGEGIWADILAERNTPAPFERGFAPIQHDGPIRLNVRAWGIPIVPDGTIMPREMRFRQEITL